MKKTILMTVAISVTNGTLCAASVKKDLQARYGERNVSFENLSEFESASSDGLDQSVWIYISADDSEPLLLVSDRGHLEGVPLSAQAATAMQEQGVCVEFVAEHSRADKYGAPDYAVDHLRAEAYVGTQGFKVAENGFEMDVTDRGDDGAEQVWLRIMLPAGLDLGSLEVK